MQSAGFTGVEYVNFSLLYIDVARACHGIDTMVNIYPSKFARCDSGGALANRIEAILLNLLAYPFCKNKNTKKFHYNLPTLIWWCYQPCSYTTILFVKLIRTFVKKKEPTKYA